MASPEPEALGAVAFGVIELDELLEDGLLGFRRDAGAVVADFDAHLPAAFAAGQQDGAAGGVAQGVADEVVQDAFEQQRVALDPQAGGAQAQALAAQAGFAAVVHLDPFEQRLQREGLDLPVEGAHVEREMSSRLSRRFSMVSAEMAICSTEPPGVGAWGFWPSSATNRPRACMGWRRSWLAAAREAGLGAAAALGLVFSRSSRVAASTWRWRSVPARRRACRPCR